uniref:Uncharacterized protein n=1 Tax=Quercus lobata TaxID=97700 RepID=A0A7N2LQH7_QUELO
MTQFSPLFFIIIVVVISIPTVRSDFDSSTIRLHSEDAADLCGGGGEGPVAASCPVNCFRTDPVCGVDGVTYWCGCADALCAGVKVAKLGFCEVSFWRGQRHLLLWVSMFCSGPRPIGEASDLPDLGDVGMVHVSGIEVPEWILIELGNDCWVVEGHWEGLENQVQSDLLTFITLQSSPNLAYEVCQTLKKVVPFEDNGSCSGSDTEFQGSLQSEKIIDRKASLQNPVSSGGAAEEIYDCSLKESSNHLSAVASGEMEMLQKSMLLLVVMVLMLLGALCSSSSSLKLVTCSSVQGNGSCSLVYDFC